jgi:hypothetical protein
MTGLSEIGAESAERVRNPLMGSGPILTDYEQPTIWVDPLDPSHRLGFTTRLNPPSQNFQ